MQKLIVILLIVCFFSHGFSETLNCLCGKTNPDFIFQRIVNGTESHPHKYPWMVHIQLHIYVMWINACGGSIISDRTILTAAHCLSKTPEPKNVRIITGVHTVTKPLDDQIYNTVELIFHPSLIPNERYDTYDMAIIVVDRSIEFSPKAMPICLPDNDNDEVFWNKKMIVAGWGETRIKIDKTTLMETEVHILPNEICNNELSKIRINYNDMAMLCANEEFGGTCQGDSGGPLFGNYNGNYNIIIGVTSFGKDCGSDIPAVYAKVSDPQTLNWINSVIKEFSGNICKTPENSK